jgi:hypothetical protein
MRSALSGSGQLVRTTRISAMAPLLAVISFAG